MVRCGSLRAVRFGTVRRGQSWLGGCVKARCGNVRRGSVWFGKAVMARCVLLGSDMVRRLRRGPIRQGGLSYGKAVWVCYG